jgi:hypothetical protein
VGLLTGLLLFPVTGPLRGLQFVLEQIQAEADAVLLDARRVHTALVQLSLQLDMGAISEEEYEEQEALLLERLNAIDAQRSALEAEYRMYAADDELESGEDDGQPTNTS